MLGVQASAIARAWYYGDFGCDYKNDKANGAYFQINQKMHYPLLIFALCIAPDMREKEQKELDKQRAAKIKKRRLLRQKKSKAAQHEYATALTYIDIANLPACWKTPYQARREFAKLEARRQRKIR